MLTRIIGDVHGRYEQYKRLIADVPRSIQVGDMGVGFRKTQGPRAGEIYSNPPHYAMVRGDHRFIPGNHDNPEECRKHSQCIPSGHVESGALGPVMFIGGALSIDQHLRQEGYNWWPGEELSIAELNELVDKYIVVKPAVMITHECPEEVAVEVGRIAGITKLNPRFASRTRQALQAMWSAHSPKIHCFGHWHASFDHVLNGTRFICLAELEYKDLEI